ncbi:hypothetical protein [Mucilaginibacter antarcticus]|uniref:hypothetical protein n=1 Tax=Mucilaginibacter antarcticus TaxID=1855725 RepID=UPI00363179DE
MGNIIPRDIVSISNKVTENLRNYFGLKGENIKLIYNGLKDEYNNQPSNYLPGKQVIIAYPAKIYDLKRQLKIVENLKGKLLPAIEIHFIGTGPQYDELKERCKNEPSFSTLGFVDRIPEYLATVDYIMLYSEREGCPPA